MIDLFNNPKTSPEIAKYLQYRLKWHATVTMLAI